jgi:hypothetical protein
MTKYGSGQVDMMLDAYKEELLRLCEWAMRDAIGRRRNSPMNSYGHGYEDGCVDSFTLVINHIKDSSHD